MNTARSAGFPAAVNVYGLPLGWWSGGVTAAEFGGLLVPAEVGSITAVVALITGPGPLETLR